ncbi:MAG TPA: response regulator [Anaerolineae bacterium]|nr:response regulator [Anaerolineales bacterium]HRV93356.1 response regulator [Anaerolineae bacterium]
MHNTSLTILVVEDNAGDYGLLELALKRTDYYQSRLIRAETFAEALDYLDNHTADIILLDLSLPDMWGVDTVRRLKDHVPATPIIVLTGYEDETVGTEVVQAGAQDYFVKGEFSGNIMLRAIRYAIERQRLMLKELHSNEERFRQVVSSISDHIYVSEIKEDGQQVNLYLSPHIASLTGYPLEKFAEDWHFWPSTVIYPDDRPIAALQASRLLKGKNSEVEYRLLREDGEIIWVRDSARVKAENNTKIIYGVVSNITERKRLEDQLHQSQKMEAIGRLAGGIAHDFNNVLTIITGNCDFILKSEDLPDHHRNDIEQIRMAGQKAASLTQHLLTFSRQQTLQLQLVNLNQLVSNMEPMLRRLLPRTMKLTVALDPILGPVKADPGQFEHAILNLVLNAKDAMPDGGRLSIETHHTVVDDHYISRPGDINPGPYVVLVISDTGIGMTKETLNQIFEPFFTTKGVHKGTGLGLSIVHGVVKQSGGQIFVESQPDHGTTFKIYLPQSLTDQTIKDSHEPGDDTPYTNETILLIEPEDPIRDLTRRILTRYGYTVLEAQNGSEALHLAEQSHHPIHLALTDVALPNGLNADQLAKQLKSRYPQTKILFMSGYNDNAVLYQDVITNDDAFLQKPFRDITLIQKVRQLLDSN